LASEATACISAGCVAPAETVVPLVKLYYRPSYQLLLESNGCRVFKARQYVDNSRQSVRLQGASLNWQSWTPAV